MASWERMNDDVQCMPWLGLAGLYRRALLLLLCVEACGYLPYESESQVNPSEHPLFDESPYTHQSFSEQAKAYIQPYLHTGLAVLILHRGAKKATGGGNITRLLQQNPSAVGIFRLGVEDKNFHVTISLMSQGARQ